MAMAVPKSINRSAPAGAVQRSHTPANRKTPRTNSAIVAVHARNGVEDVGMNELSSVEAGLQTVGPTIDSAAATRAAQARKVEVTPLSIYSRGPLRREGLQLGFAAVNGQEIRRGVHQLAIALEQLASPQL
jgi:hypothetical protein